MLKLTIRRLDEKSNKSFYNKFMSDNLYPNVGDEPLLNNARPPPPPPPRHNNPYNAPPNQPYVQNQNPSFNNYQNPPFQSNPNYPYPQGYAPYNQPQVVASVGNHQIVSNNGGVFYNPPVPGLHPMYAMAPHCPICRRDTSSITRQVPGGVTWIWCFVLFVVTGVCCCIPFCVDSCQDTEVVCATCQCVKARIDANCC